MDNFKDLLKEENADNYNPVNNKIKSAKSRQQQEKERLLKKHQMEIENLQKKHDKELERIEYIFAGL